jgi:hypothetical protein
VDALFPSSETTYQSFVEADQSSFSAAIRKLPGGRTLLAMGVGKRGDQTNQVVLIRDSDLRFFFPWIER